MRALALAALGAARVASGAGETVHVVATLNEDRVANPQEYILGRAYRLAAVEYLSQRSFAELDGESAGALFAAYNGASPNSYVGPLHGHPGHVLNFTIARATDTASSIRALNATLAWLSGNTSSLAVLGGYSSSKASEEAAWAARNRVPLVSPGAATAKIFNVTGKGFAFGLLSTTRQLGNSTMAFLDEAWQAGRFAGSPPLRVAVLFENATHGTDYLAGVSDYVAGAPGASQRLSLVYNASFPLYDNSTMWVRRAQHVQALQSAVDNLAAAVGLGEGLANVLLVDAHAEDFVWLQQILSARDFSFRAISFGARGTDAEDVATLSKLLAGSKLASLQGLFAGLWWSPGSKLPESQRFVTAWRKHEATAWLSALRAQEQAGQELFLFASPAEQLPPSWFGAVAYEAFQVVMEAVGETGAGAGAEALRAQIGRTNRTRSLLPGGQLSFNKGNQAAGPSTFAQNSLAEGLTPFIVGPAKEASTSLAQLPPFRTQRPRCTADWYVVTTSACSVDGESRTVEYRFRDGAKPGTFCPTPGLSCWCAMAQDGASALGAAAPNGGGGSSGGGSDSNSSTMSRDAAASFTVPCEYVQPGSSTAATVTALAGVGIGVSALALLLTAAKWADPHLAGADRANLVCVALAGMWAAASLLSFIGENTDRSCRTRIVTLLLGVGMLLALLAARISYWYRVWSTPTVETLSMPRWQAAAPAVALFGAVALVVLVWMLLDDNLTATATTTIKGVTLVYQTCDFTGTAAPPVVVLSLFALALVLSIVLAYQSKDADARYAETWFLFIAASKCMLAAFVLAIVFALARLGSAGAATVVLSSCVLIAVLVVVLCSLLPRVLAAFDVGAAAHAQLHGTAGEEPRTSDLDPLTGRLKFIRGRMARKGAATNASTGTHTNDWVPTHEDPSSSTAK
jgi:branched-chain amino acid transport system substrate-binding protein